MTVADQLTPFGKPMLKHWMFDPSYKNLNHGSYGAHPIPVRDAQRAFTDMADRRPDPYIRFKHVQLLDQARQEVAGVINAPADECVFVKNATSGVYTVLFNLNFQQDECVIFFEAVYGAVEFGLQSLQEHTPLQTRKVSFEYPIAEDEIERRFRDVVSQARADGLKVRAAVFDAIVSNPGFRFPFERFVRVCRELDILSVIDGAHGIGMIHLDMTELQPDFFVSNCHKWLYTPRAAAMLYVPKRNQHLIRTTLPTSWGFVPAPEPSDAPVVETGNGNGKSRFVKLFEDLATDDYSSYICVPAALKFRREVCGGEDAILSYCHALANEAADLLADALDTVVLQEPDLEPGQTSRMRQCCMTTIRLPIGVADDGTELPGAWGTISAGEVDSAIAFLARSLVLKHDTFVPIFRYGSYLWFRISAQVFLEKSDFEWLAGILKVLCEQVAKKQFKEAV